MELTEIDVWGLRVLEPVTAFTDLITATVCFVAFARLRALARPEREHRWMANYFLFMGTAVTFSAFIGHAFLYFFTPAWKMIGWTSSALAIWFVEMSSLEAVKQGLKPQWVSLWRGIFFVQWLVFMALIVNPATRSFEMVKLNSSVGLAVVVLALQGYHYWHSREDGRLLLMLGIVMGIFPAIIYTGQISLHRWFNYHDISHLLMALDMYVIYRGARLIALNREQPQLEGWGPPVRA